MSNIASTPLISTLERYLTLTAESEKRTTSNMANVDTPGYHTREINFASEMQRATVNAGFENAGFENAGGTGLSPASRDVQGLLERPDGNNVNLDREGLMLSRSQLQYQMGIQLVKHEFHGLFSAINGGN